MEKRIDLEDGNKIIISSNSHYCGSIITINKGYFENGELLKTIRLSIWDDFGFEGWINQESEEIKEIDFTFKQKDPLYKHLDELLGQDKKIIIDDDATREENKKIMIIYKENEDIIIRFENQLENQNMTDKFNIFIKNVLTDYRSKIDYNGYDTKKRLIKFFNNVQQELLIDNEKIKKLK